MCNHDPFNGNNEYYEIACGMRYGLLPTDAILATAEYLPDPVPLTGIYFLIHRDEIVYVGQSTDIDTRIKAHRLKRNQPGMMFDSYAYVLCDASHLNDLEAEYIMALEPKRNMTVPPNAKWVPFWKLEQELGLSTAKVVDLLIEHGIRSRNGRYRREEIEELRRKLGKAGGDA